MDLSNYCMGLVNECLSFKENFKFFPPHIMSSNYGKNTTFFVI